MRVFKWYSSHTTVIPCTPQGIVPSRCTQRPILYSAGTEKTLLFTGMSVNPVSLLIYLLNMLLELLFRSEEHTLPEEEILCRTLCLCRLNFFCLRHLIDFLDNNTILDPKLYWVNESSNQKHPHFCGCLIRHFIRG